MGYPSAYAVPLTVRAIAHISVWISGGREVNWWNVVVGREDDGLAIACRSPKTSSYVGFQGSTLFSD